MGVEKLDNIKTEFDFLSIFEDRARNLPFKDTHYFRLTQEEYNISKGWNCGHCIVRVECWKSPLTGDTFGDAQFVPWEGY